LFILCSTINIFKNFDEDRFIKEKSLLYNYIGCAHRRIGNVEMSISFLKKALEEGKKVNKTGLPLLNLGAIYS